MAVGTPTSIGSTDTSGTSATVVLTTTATVAVGQLIAVAIISSIVGRVLNTVTDSAGNTYTIDMVAQSTNSINTYIASTLVTTQLASGGTITGTFATSASSTRKIAAVQVSGIRSGTRIDGTNAIEDVNSTAWHTGTVVTTFGDVLLFGAAGLLVTATSTPVTGTELFDLSANARGFTVVYQIQTVTGTYELAGTWSTTHRFEAPIVAYLGIAAGATVIPTVNQAPLVPSGSQGYGDRPGRG